MDHIDCPKHGRTRVTCTNWRLQYYRCSQCVEEAIVANDGDTRGIFFS